jgi:ATP-binding cassette, subfamily C, type I secretion system permease/ATPase
MDALRDCGRRMTKIALFSGAINLLTLSGSIYMLQVYDRVIPSRNMSTLASLSIILMVAYLLQGYLDALRSRMLARTAAIFDISLQGSIFDTLAMMPLLGVRAAEAKQPALDIESIRTFLSGMGPTALLDIPWTPLFALVLFLFHPLIGIAALFGAACIIGVTILTDKRSAASIGEASRWLAQRHAWADSTQQNADVITALGMLPALRTRWLQINAKALREHIVTMDILARMGASGKVMHYGLQSAILGLGAYLVITDRASAGIMIASSIIMGRALAPIEIALGTWRQWVGARQAFARLRGTLQRAARQTPKGSTSFPRKSLSVQSLSVVAPGAAGPILSDISFDLEATMGLAIVGPSASGKTTLAKALVGVWPATRGVVKLDDLPLEHWQTDAFGRALGYLPQEVSLFQGTIAENIARFDVTAPASAIVEAAILADAHAMIMQLPNAYHTSIGEGGVRLSAGQRQRVGLARAAFGNPFLVVLDEPNSNLDQEGEMALDNAVRALRQRGSIVIVISHRPKAVRNLDRLMVLVKGRMLAFGTQGQVSAALATLTTQGSAVGTAAQPVAGKA